MTRMSETTKYTLYGALFGLCFPLGAVIFLYLLGEFSGLTNPADILAQAHRNHLLYIIDTAPLFLGLFARIAGKRQDRLLHFSESLEQQVVEKTESLRRALEEAKRANETIAHMAEHDALTGLLNRRRFQKELEKWSQHALRYQRSGALIFIDLDEFKFVNDTYGHTAGDRYLSGISELLTKTMRTTDTIARWGGDEFAILIPETPREAAIEVANKLLQSFNETSLDVGGHQLRPSASIGMALFPEHGTDLDELVMYADAAMYEAKAAGRNRWRLYSASSQEMERIQEHIQWEGRLRRALENDQFLLFYQPVLRLSDHVTPGYEALLRMEDRDGKLISPGLFLESAERFGLSVPIDYMVIRKATRKIAILSSYDIWISLNLSRASLDDAGLFDHIEAAVTENALRPGQLHIEITEAAAMEYLNQVQTLIMKLKSIGCRVVLDDFGHGPANLYLRQLPVDMVKINGDLIRSLSTHENNRALVKNITEVAHEKGIQVTAKHVEDEALVEILRDLGVDYAQGFAIGRPVEAIEQMQSFVSATEN
jgi:diguanylate cyclase (GGDEF)-like protein